MDKPRRDPGPLVPLAAGVYRPRARLVKAAPPLSLTIVPSPPRQRGFPSPVRHRFAAVGVVRTYTRLRVRRPFGFLFQIVQTLVLTVVVYAALQAFVAQPYRVVQGSMQDTLHEGQFILIDKLTPRFDPYQRGDIVVFRPPARAAERDDTPYIKRVIGVPGDRLEIRDGQVWVNDVPLDESEYVYDGEPTYAFDQRITSWDVPPDSLFVLGDNRTNSADSRTARIGFIPLDDVLGRAFLRYWPIGTLAVLDTPDYPQLTVGSGDASIEAP